MTADSPSDVSAQAKPVPTRTQQLQSFLFKWHLPIMLVVLVLFGFLVPAPGRWLADNTELSTACVVFIFLVSGLKLKTDEITEALSDWLGIIVGLVLILGVTPLMGFAAREVPLGSDAVSNGFALFFAMPTTISSGVVLTTQAKGNKAMALFFSVVTNMLGTVTAPFFLGVLLRGDGVTEDTVDVVGILARLALTVVLPLLVGKCLRWFDVVRSMAKVWSNQLKLASSFILVLIPWMKVSESSSQIAELDGGIIAAMFGLGAGFHVVLLIVNAVVVLLVPLSNASRKAIIIMGSQKTVAIAVAFLALLPDAMQPGVMVIPAIISHFSQIVIDAFVATWLITALPSARDEDDDAKAELTARSSSTTPQAGVAKREGSVQDGGKEAGPAGGGAEGLRGASV